MQCFTSPKAVCQWEPNIRPGKSPSRRWIVSRVSVRMGEREALAVFPHLSFWSAQTAEIAEKNEGTGICAVSTAAHLRTV